MAYFWLISELIQSGSGETSTTTYLIPGKKYKNTWLHQGKVCFCLLSQCLSSHPVSFLTSLIPNISTIQLWYILVCTYLYSAERRSLTSSTLISRWMSWIKLRHRANCIWDLFVLAQLISINNFKKSPLYYGSPCFLSNVISSSLLILSS